MTRRPLLSALSALSSLTLALAACGGDSSSSGGGGSGGTFTRPDGTVAVSFVVDDTANAVYADGDLVWTGSFRYATGTRLLALDASANGPYPTLRDDGPWTEGGHEPEGEVAGDHRHGATVFVTPPLSPASELDFEYRLADRTYAALPPEGFGTGDVWPGASGEFAVPGGVVGADIVLPDVVLPAFGTNDLKLVLDLDALAPGGWDTSRAYVLCSLFPWTDVRLLDDGRLGDDAAGDGKVTLLLSEMTGPGNPFDHDGLLTPGTVADFHFVLTRDPYRDPGGAALATGVTAFARPAGGTFGALGVTVEGGELRVTLP